MCLEPSAQKAQSDARPTTTGTRSSSSTSRIEHIYQELDMQVRRLGQLQADFDRVRTTLKQLMGVSE